MILLTALNAWEWFHDVALGRTVAAGLAYNIGNATDSFAEFKLVGKDRQREGRSMYYKTYYEPSPGIIRSTGEPAILRYWEAADGSGMWVQSNYWGKLGTSNRTLGSREHMQSTGGVEVEPDFWVFEKPVTAYIKFSDVRPMAAKEP